MAARDEAPEWAEGAVFFDGFDNCIVGLAMHFNRPVVIYSHDRCLTKLYDDFVSDCEENQHTDCEHWSDAEEWMSFNVTGAWVGENTPVFLMQEA